MTSSFDTGRPADIDPDDLANVADHDDLARVIERMLADLRKHPGEWENNTLERYLDALAAQLQALPALYSNLGEPLPDQPTWRVVAEILLGATGYE